jgi:hypothetical protein
VTAGEQDPGLAPRKPSFRSRLTILLIGGAALGLIVLMCVAVLLIALRS